MPQDPERPATTHMFPPKYANHLGVGALLRSSALEVDTAFIKQWLDEQVYELVNNLGHHPTNIFERPILNLGMDSYLR